jgi:hypothetical protein
MSKWTKVLFSVAVFSQVMTVFVLLDCKHGEAYYITETDWFLLALCSCCSITYVFAGMISHKNDVAIANF